MKHYNEVDLLESVYLGGGTPEITQHLSECADCRQREIRLQAKLSCSAQAHQQRIDAKPEFFWAKQRSAIVRRVSGAAQGNRRRAALLAAAAALTLTLAIGVLSTVNEDPAPGQTVETGTSTITAVDPEVSVSDVPADPWESDSLEPYAGVVEWESWLDEEGKGTES